MNEDRPDLEGPPVEGGFFHEGHHGHDGVLTAEIVVEPEFVNEPVAMLLQELDAFSAGTRNPRDHGERTEVVYAKDDGRRRDDVFSHPIIMTLNHRENSGLPVGWDGPYYRADAEGFEALFLPSPDEVLDEVCNVDVEVRLPDGSRWSATIFTLAEVDRLMKRWEESGEAAGGRCFWCSDALIVRGPGIQGMVSVIAELLASGEFDGAFHRLSDPE